MLQSKFNYIKIKKPSQFMFFDFSSIHNVIRKYTVVIVLLSVFFSYFKSQAQCPFSQIALPDTICPVFNFNAVNPNPGNLNFTWDFCSGYLTSLPVDTGYTGSIPGHLAIKALKENGKYFLFFPGLGTTEIFRADLNNAFNSVPAITSTGTSGYTTDSPWSFDMIKDTGKTWIGFLPDYNTNKLYKVQFDSINDNQVTYTDLGIPGLNAPVNVKIIGNSVFVVSYYNSSLMRIDFNTSFNDTVSVNQIPIPANAFSGIDVIFDCKYNEYFCFISNTINGEIYRLDLGTDVKNNTPSVNYLYAQFSSIERALSFVFDNNKWYFFTNNYAPGRILEYELGDIKNDSAIKILDLASTFATALNSFSAIRDSNKLELFLANFGSSYGRFEFRNSCNYYNAWIESDVPQNFSYGNGVNGTQYYNIYASYNGNVTYQYSDSVLVTTTAPSAGFINSPACFGAPVSFQDTSLDCIGTIVNWFWDFGDFSGTSTLSNPQYTYSNTGDYIVTLTVTSSGGLSSTVQKTISVILPPVVQFVAEDTACANTTIQITNNSYSPSGLPVSSLWYFGNGDTLNASVPNYSYPDAGNFNIVLTVSDAAGCIDSTSKAIEILPAPVPLFTVENTCVNDSAVFLNTTDSNGIQFINYNWNFGDNEFSALFSPSHFFQAGQGNYEVTLTASTSNGCSDSVKQQVLISNKANPDFSFIPLQACAGNPISFSDLSTTATGDSIALLTWDFGDSTGLANGNNVSHVYASPGTYTVTLFVKTYTSCDTAITKDIVVIPGPQAAFNFTNTCLNNANLFSDNSIIYPGDPVSGITWYFGDNTSGNGLNTSHTYSAPGTFTVTQIVSSQLGCIDTSVNSVVVYPLPKADFTTSNIACTNDSTFFVNLSSIINDTIAGYTWNFGNNNYSNLKDPGYVFTQIGFDSVMLYVYSIHNCSDTAIKIINVLKSPEHDFTYSGSCEANITSFNSINLDTTLSLLNWYWNFDDNSFSSLQNPIHLYSAYGTYDVSVVSTAVNGCSRKVIKPVTINPNPKAHFSTLNPCSGQTVQLTDSSILPSGQITSWQWIINNTDTSYASEVFFNAGNPSVIPVQFTAVSDSGCADTLLTSITILLSPVAQFITQPPYATPGQIISLNSVATGQALWNFGDSNTDTGSPVTHSYSDTGNYLITLNVIADNGCSDSVSSLYPVLIPKPDLYVTNLAATLNNNLLSVEAIIYNLSNFDVTQFQISSTASGLQPVYEFPSAFIAKGTFINYKFQSKLFIENNMFPEFICVEVDKPNGLTDLNYSNNILCRSFTNEFSIISLPSLPAGDILTVVYSLPVDADVELKIFDSKGSLIINEDLGINKKGFNKADVDIVKLTPGIYFLKLETETGTVIQKFSKN